MSHGHHKYRECGGVIISGVYAKLVECERRHDGT